MSQSDLPPKLVIFDCDGVLVDTEGPVNEVLADLLSTFGPAITAAECMERFIGGTMAAVGERATEAGYAIPPDWTDVIYPAVYERLRQGVDVIEGAPQVLDTLDAARIPYCVGSNGPMEKMDITLGATGMLERLRGRIFSPHVIGLEHAKPSGGLYLHAAREMGFAPEDCVVIEDTASGSRGAKNAGIRCFGYTGETKPEVLIAEGATPFGRMKELPGLLGL